MPTANYHIKVELGGNDKEVTECSREVDQLIAGVLKSISVDRIEAGIYSSAELRGKIRKFDSGESYRSLPIRLTQSSRNFQERTFANIHDQLERAEAGVKHLIDDEIDRALRAANLAAELKSDSKVRMESSKGFFWASGWIWTLAIICLVAGLLIGLPVGAISLHKGWIPPSTLELAPFLTGHPA